MSRIWICAHGHQTDQHNSLNHTACPICGEPLRLKTSTVVTPFDNHATVDAPLSALDKPLNTLDKPLNATSLDIETSFVARGMQSLFGSKPGDSTLLKGLDIPGYEIISELGRGGMGVVYKARQTGLNRTVALKMILAAEHAGPEQKARFKSEAQAVAQLLHPNIVQIYETGEVQGRPYFSLEYVDGGSLAQKLEGKPQHPRLTAGFIETVARAVAVANAQNIIHRDLKPANILLANPLNLTDGSGIRTLQSFALQSQHPFGFPKITDFGLAKRLESGVVHTQSGSIVGTPSYMAPEQASGKLKEVGPHTDVYSLGAILYEMLTGRPPFDSENPVETIMKVLRDEPVPPTKSQPKIPRDLEIICMKCLEKSPAKRYPNANELADDIHRFLDGEPISARPATKWEKAQKWIRRNPTKAGLIGTGVLASIALLTVGLISYNQISDSLAEQTRLRDESHERSIRLTVANGTEYLNKGEYLRALPFFAEALRLEKEKLNRPMLADEKQRILSAIEMHQIRQAAVLKDCPRLVQAWFHNGRVNDAAFSSDGQFVVTASADGWAMIFQATRDSISTDDPIFKLDHEGKSVLRVQYSPNSKYILTVCDDLKVYVWDAKKGERVGQPIVHKDAIKCATFDHQEKRILTTSADKTAQIWDIEAADRKPIIISHTGSVLHGEFSPDDTVLATACADGTARVWDAKGNPISPVLPHAGPIVCIHFSPDGKQLVTASEDRTAMIWEAKSGKRVTNDKPIRRQTPLTDASFSPNGRDVALCSKDGTARIWDVKLNDWRTFVVTHDATIVDIEFSPDGQACATASEDNTSRVWDVFKGKLLVPPLQHNGAVYRNVFSSDGAMLLTASQDGLVRLWDLAAGRVRSETALTKKQMRVQKVYSPDRKRFLQTDAKDNKSVRIYAASTEEAEEQIQPMQHDGKIMHICFSPDGRFVLTASADQTARVWDASTGIALGEAMKHGSDVVFAIFSPDGSCVATAGNDNLARVWKADTGRPITPPLRHNTVRRIVFSPDGRCLLTTGEDEQVRIWDSVTGESLMPARKPSGWVAQVLRASDQTTGWDLPPDQRELQQIEWLARWLSAQQIDTTTGGLVPLERSKLKESWDGLRNFYPKEFDRSDISKWHKEEAEAAEETGEWFAVVFHLNGLLRTINTSDNQNVEDRNSLLLRRARAYAEEKKYIEAVKDFDAALGSNKVESSDGTLTMTTQLDDEAVLIGRALTHLAAGNEKGYRDGCQQLLLNYGRSAHDESAARLAFVCLIRPDCMKKGDDLWELGVNATGGKEAVLPSCQIAYGATLARLEQWQEARQFLMKGQVLADPIDAVRAWLYLALVHQKLEQPEEASRWFQQSNMWLNYFTKSKTSPKYIPLTWQQRLELEMLKREVEMGGIKKGK